MLNLAVRFLIVCLVAVAVNVEAADFKVNEKQLKQVSEGDLKKIEQNLKSNRLMLPGDKIVGVAGIAEGSGMWDPGCDLKKAACDVAAAAAAANCGGAPPVIAVCIAAVEAARQACRNC